MTAPPTVRVLTGIGVSTGAATGPAARMAARPVLPAARTVDDPTAERRAVADAFAAVAADLAARAAAVAGTAGDVLAAQAEMAADTAVAEAADAAVAGGADGPHAVHAAFGEFRAMFESAGGFLAERVTDLDDIRDRVVAALLGLPLPGIPRPGHPYVLVAVDLAPADTATLDPSAVLALITERGGPTSHTAILARALGIPAVVACPGALDIADGVNVTVDGSGGRVEVGSPARPTNPGARAAAPSAVAGRTADGLPIALLLNIGDATVPTTRGEGVGLFRTELLFLSRRQAPEVEEQRRVYAEVFRAHAGQPVVIRTLDAGADKPLPFLTLADEPNPALGVRGYRTARHHPDVLDAQLRAIALAVADTGADVRVMAPMISTAAEAAAFVDRARSHGIASAGVMVEVPAAAMRAGDLLTHVDFVSIGTNDLSQYLMAADRQTGEFAELLDPWQPALLALIGGCAAAGRAVGKPVGVCGEAAADPLLAPVLAGLGVTSLSMSSAALPAVAAALGGTTASGCAAAARAALAAPDPAAARDGVRRALGH